MRKLDVGGLRLNYVEHGSGPETVVLAHSYLVDHRQYEQQIAVLKDHYRVIAYDHRDHGASDRAINPYRLEHLVADAVSLIKQTEAAPCHFAGLSTGGFVGMRLALYHRELLRSITLMDSSAEAEPWYKRVKYRAMFLALRTIGIQPLLRTTMGLMFGQTQLANPNRAADLEIWRQRIAANDPAALIRFGNAIFGRTSVLEELRSVDVPALVLAGEEDRALPPKLSKHLADALPNAELQLIPKAGHLSTIENPTAVNTALLRFLKKN